VSAGRLIACTAVGEARGVDAAAAAVAVSSAMAVESEGALLIDLRAGSNPPRGTLLASSSARALERTAGDIEGMRAAARGRICVARPAEPDSDRGREAVEELIAPPLIAPVVLCVTDPPGFRDVLESAPGGSRAALLKTAPGAERSLIALLAGELRAEGVPVKAWTSAIGLIPARRALAGLEPGGATGRRAARFASVLAPARGRPRLSVVRPELAAERGQALPAVLGAAILVIALALILVAIGGASTAKGRMQRAADLGALSAARSMRDDFPRLFVPATLPDGSPNPAHLERAAYLARAEATARDAAERNGIDADLVRVHFPDARSMAPLRVVVDARAEVDAGSGESGETAVSAEAEVTPPSAGTATSQPTMASGGGYSGPLAYRQGKPMRPDVAEAFDRMAKASADAGVALVINSAYRSDAEQQRLWEQHPDPTWVAPPGTSLHRCATELDLGPPDAYGWLAANAPRFGFLQRYSWEAWHYGYIDGPEPCSAEGNRIGADARAEADGRQGADQGLPSFVPPQYREPLLAAAARHDVSAALLASQLMAESNFNPNAVSPVGAQGIAQFMPSTAIAYGLDDPFDPIASIEAQARMMGGLLDQFGGSVELALAAYNAGPAAVAACNCVPPYPETQAYVARIMGLLDGAGSLAAPAPALEVRLVA
jgi:hypothetical protein